MNEWKSLDKVELKKVTDLKDPLLELILINGWRRSEVAQTLMSWEGGEYAHFKPKKQKKVKPHLLTPREKQLLEVLKMEIFNKTKKTLGAYNRKINRYCSAIAEKLGFDEFFPHRLRATFGTSLSRMGVSDHTIKAAMNHKNIKTTEGYIQPSEDDILEAKELNAELITLDGMTIHEWRRFALEKVKQIHRLEKQVKKCRS